MKNIFYASPALATLTHPRLFHRCMVPWCFSACVSIHHVCACCTKADPQLNKLQCVICAELSLTAGWPWHYSDGDCLTNKHFRFANACSSQCCCCYGDTQTIRGHLGLKWKKRWSVLFKKEKKCKIWSKICWKDTNILLRNYTWMHAIYHFSSTGKFWMCNSGE